jgi:hypothetical protein
MIIKSLKELEAPKCEHCGDVKRELVAFSWMLSAQVKTYTLTKDTCDALTKRLENRNLSDITSANVAGQLKMLSQVKSSQEWLLSPARPWIRQIIDVPVDQPDSQTMTVLGATNFGFRSAEAGPCVQCGKATHWATYNNADAVFWCGCQR